jgi:O-antigen/teichoic acid export membrane protein
MLGLLRSDAEVGWYNAAYRITEGLIVIPTVLYNVLFPRLSILYQESKDSIKFLVQKGVKYIIAVSIPITVLGIMIASPIISVIYGTDYGNAVVSLQILLLSTSFMFIGIILLAVHNSTNHTTVALTGIIIGVVINIILNSFLIPIYGFIGASISTVIADIALFTFLYVAVVRYGYQLTLLNLTVKPLLAVLIAVTVVLFLSNINTFFQALIGSLVYIVVLVTVGFLDKEEIAIFQKLKKFVMSPLNIL